MGEGKMHKLTREEFEALDEKEFEYEPMVYLSGDFGFTFYMAEKKRPYTVAVWIDDDMEVVGDVG